MQVSFENARESLLELLVGECVAERVHGAVGVAQEVGEHEEMLVGARWGGAEAFDQRQHVVWCPAGDERSQDERDGAECLPGAVLRFGLLPPWQASRGVLSSPPPPESSAPRADKVCPGAPASSAVAAAIALRRRLSTAAGRQGRLGHGARGHRGVGRGGSGSRGRMG